jgi:O-acetyl-ADP-ribose deacetylase (regulator of RNase III)
VGCQQEKISSLINYVIGDATRPQGDGQKIVAHVCNNIGKWGAGFSGAVTKRSALPESAFRQLYVDYREGKYNISSLLGVVQVITISEDVSVANMIAQNGVVGRNNPKPIRYDALNEALRRLNSLVADTDASVHMPRIGCGLAGGDWERVEKIIQNRLEVPVFVYDLPERKTDDISNRLFD